MVGAGFANGRWMSDVVDPSLRQIDQATRNSAAGPSRPTREAAPCRSGLLAQCLTLVR